MFVSPFNAEELAILRRISNSANKQKIMNRDSKPIPRLCLNPKTNSETNDLKEQRSQLPMGALTEDQLLRALSLNSAEFDEVSTVVPTVWLNAVVERLKWLSKQTTNK